MPFSIEKCMEIRLGPAGKEQLSQILGTETKCTLYEVLESCATLFYPRDIVRYDF